MKLKALTNVGKIMQFSELCNMYQTIGTIKFPSSLIFDDQEVKKMQQLCNDVPTEYVKLGDADEPNDLYVGRFRNDLPSKPPNDVNKYFTKMLFEILQGRKSNLFFDQLIGKKNYIRRCQVNKMTTGSFIGKHLDTDSNPDYQVSIVVQLGRRYQGGAFVTYWATGIKSSFQTIFGDIIVSNCSIPHEVETVVDGNRESLVYFLGKNLNENRRIVNEKNK